MTDKAITALSSASALDGTEVVHVVQGGNSRKATVANVGLVSTGRVKLRVYLAGATNSATSWTKVPLDTVALDSSSAWDAVNKRLTPTIAGDYLVCGRARTSTTGELTIAIGFNGSESFGIGSDVLNSSGGTASSGSGLIHCNGSTDYLELFAISNTVRAFTTGSFDTWMSIVGPL